MSYVSLGSFNYKINNKNINKQKLEKQAMILKLYCGYSLYITVIILI